MRKRFLAFRKAISHWGIIEYGMLCILWIILSIPLYLLGWGVLSILSFPLLLIIGYLITKAFMLILDNPNINDNDSVRYLELIDDARFGVVKKIGNFEYQIDTEWCGREIVLRVNCADGSLFQKSLNNAVVLVGMGQELLDSVLLYSCKNLLGIINEQFTAQGLQHIDCRDFNNTISLESIDIDDSGSYSFSFDDGGLLGGHSIIVDGSLEGGPNYIDTPG